MKQLIAMDAFADLRYFYSVTRGTPEAEPAFRTIVASIRPTDVVVEVGAAKGGGTLSLSARARHVFAFEPNKYNYRLLRHFTKHRRNVSTFNAAVGGNEGVARLNIVSGEATAQGCSIKELQGLSYRGYMVAKMVSLDHVRFPIAPSVLVVDCEGYEGEVLLGARKTMDQVRQVFIETHVVGGGQSTLSSVLSQVEAVPMSTSVFRSDDQLSWVSGVRQEKSGATDDTLEHQEGSRT